LLVSVSLQLACRPYRLRGKFLLESVALCALLASVLCAWSSQLHDINGQKVFEMQDENKRPTTYAVVLTLVYLFAHFSVFTVFLLLIWLEISYEEKAFSTKHARYPCFVSVMRSIARWCIHKDDSNDEDEDPADPNRLAEHAQSTSDGNVVGHGVSEQSPRPGPTKGWSFRNIIGAGSHIRLQDIYGKLPSVRSRRQMFGNPMHGAEAKPGPFGTHDNAMHENPMHTQAGVPEGRQPRSTTHKLPGHTVVRSASENLQAAHGSQQDLPTVPSNPALHNYTGSSSGQMLTRVPSSLDDASESDDDARDSVLM
jgi:hypothetical protein